MKKDYDYLIVGAGLFGATFAWHARQAGKRCLVVDRRPHTGGGVHDRLIEGINVHEYGPHIFHTSDEGVWRLACRFVRFNRFRLHVKANYKGRIYSLPFNLNTFREMWGTATPEEARRKLEEQRYRGEIHNLEEQALSLVGRDVYETLVKGYTEKQWGRPCRELPAFIIRRLPVRLTYDDDYFNDTWQGIPEEGYRRLVDGLLEGVEVRTGTDFSGGLDREWRRMADRLVYTGRMDEFYHGCYGHLQYRSLRFEHEVREIPDAQGTALMNYTDRGTPHTRVVEHKHFAAFGEEVRRNPVTALTREYPAAYVPGGEAYYPVNDERNNRLYARYKALAERETDVVFGGRLAEYRYYDMDRTMRSAMDAWERECRRKI